MPYLSKAWRSDAFSASRSFVAGFRPTAISRYGTRTSGILGEGCDRPSSAQTEDGFKNNRTIKIFAQDGREAAYTNLFPAAPRLYRKGGLAYNARDEGSIDRLIVNIFSKR